MGEGAKWCVVMTKPMAEHVAAKSLRSAGWPTYLPLGRKMLKGSRIDPMTNRRVRTRGPGEVVMRPAIDGYLFAELHPGQKWGAMLKLPGVRDLLRSMDDSRELALLTPQGIEAMRLDENAGIYDEDRCRRGKPTSPSGLEVGDTVKIEVSGILFEAVLEHLGPNDRAIVRYMIFGRDTRTHTAASTLELVAS